MDPLQIVAGVPAPVGAAGGMKLPAAPVGEPGLAPAGLEGLAAPSGLAGARKVQVGGMFAPPFLVKEDSGGGASSVSGGSQSSLLSEEGTLPASPSEGSLADSFGYEAGARACAQSPSLGAPHALRLAPLDDEGHHLDQRFLDSHGRFGARVEALLATMNAFHVRGEPCGTHTYVLGTRGGALTFNVAYFVDICHPLAPGAAKCALTLRIQHVSATGLHEDGCQVFKEEVYGPLISALRAACGGPP